MTPDLAERFSLTGRTALITGASGALGGRFAQVLAGAGANVVLTGRRTAPMQALAGRLGDRAAVNIASILGLRQGAGVSAYATSKAALIQMTKSHALEWARHGIRVNALAPGYIQTDINRDFFATEAGRAQIERIPMRRLGHARELDGALLLLASDAGAFITGAVLAADGGHLLSPL